MERNALWSYPRVVPSHFSGAPAISETIRAYEPPDFAALPKEADLEMELYDDSGAPYWS